MIFVIHSFRNIATNFKTWINSKKVDRAIKFKQSTWPKPDISLNIKYRAKAKSDFEIIFPKITFCFRTIVSIFSINWYLVEQIKIIKKEKKEIYNLLLMKIQEIDSLL